MHTKNGCFSLIVTAFLVSAPSTPRAQETPFALTGSEYACRQLIARQTTWFANEASECLTECRTNPSRRCDLVPDPQTADCLDSARGVADGRIRSRCGGFSCPDCYFADCDDYSAVELNGAAIAAALVTNQIFCDDASSPDGLSSTEARCQRGSAAVSQRFVRALQRCIEGCQRQVRDNPEASFLCDPANVDTQPFEAKTQACIDRARERFDLTCRERCSDAPECIASGCATIAALTESAALVRARNIYCTDRPDSPPPPPGAPDANPDGATTSPDLAVKIDVLENDAPNSELALDPDSLAIVTDPAHGSALVNADHTVTYTPAAGFSGTDTFTYRVCSVPDPVAPCDVANVRVTVAP